MSDFPPLPAIPLMSPAKARDIARTFQALAVSMREQDVIAEARLLESRSAWWLAYALVLDRTGPEAPEENQR